eukprot:scaffold2601_cov198-Pinguiococcus_pyrenoidosus.AAC.9
MSGSRRRRVLAVDRGVDRSSRNRRAKLRKTPAGATTIAFRSLFEPQRLRDRRSSSMLQVHQGPGLAPPHVDEA